MQRLIKFKAQIDRMDINNPSLAITIMFPNED